MNHMMDDDTTFLQVRVPITPHGLRAYYPLCALRVQAAHFFAELESPTAAERGFHAALVIEDLADGSVEFGYAVYHGDVASPPLTPVARLKVARCLMDDPSAERRSELPPAARAPPAPRGRPPRAPPRARRPPAH